MRKILVVVVLSALASGAAADEIFIPIAGSVGVFSTDMRLVNPSAEDTIVVQAFYLPRNNVDNSAVTAKEVTIPPRQMAVFDDVVASLFLAGDLGGIRLISDDPFSATARIFAQSAEGTLGQFVVGVPIESALEKGILLQLDSSDDFRTNVGMLNPDRNGPAVVNLALYNSANVLVATREETLQPWGVIAPTNVAALFPSATGDLSDAWISYSADKPVIVYGSVIDNGTTDPTYVPAVIDTGSASAPPQQVVRTFDVTAFQWGYTFRENGQVLEDVVISKDSKVIMRFRTNDVRHGFSMSPYVSVVITPGSTREAEFIAHTEGTFQYFCTESDCGAGHPNMFGTLQIGKEGERPGGPGYSTSAPSSGSSAGSGSADHAHHHEIEN